MSDFNFAWATALVLLSSFIPGFLLVYPLLRRTKLRTLEIITFGLVFGFFIPPAMLFLESLTGVQFSFWLVLANLGLLTIIGAILSFRDFAFTKDFKLSMDLDEIAKKIDIIGYGRKNWIWVVLIIAVLFAYWVRIVGFQENPYLHNPDPYSYLVSTRYILTDGSVPAVDDLAWFPDLATHRERPLMQYMLASWYSIYTGGSAGFDHLLLLQLAVMYPAIFGALGCLLLFIFLSRCVGDEFGLFGALQGTLIPITIIMVAWGPEQAPWAIFAMLSFLASYGLLIKEERWEYAALAAVSIMGVALGSKGDLFVYAVFGAFVLVRGFMMFITGKNLKEFFLHNVLITGTAIISLFLVQFYRNEEQALITGLLLILAYLLVLFLLRGFAPKIERKQILNIIMGVLVLAVVAYLSPLGSGANQLVDSVFSEPNLFSTIAEQQLVSPDEYAQALGFIGFSIAGVKVLDIVVFIFVLILVFDFAYAGSELSILIMMAVMPIYLLFSYKLKFLSYLGIMAAIAITLTLGRIYGLTREIEEEGTGERKPSKGALDAARYCALGVAVILLTYQIISLGGGLLPFVMDGGSIQEKCSALKQPGVPDKIFCNKIPDYWINSLDWIRKNTAKNETVMAWWDYGHWINYIGERKTVVRNDLAYPEMIKDVAYLVSYDDPEAVAEYMRFKQSGAHRADYLLLDGDLFGKWTAVSYMACLDENETSTEHQFGTKRSDCEKELDFEYFQDKKLTFSDYCVGEKQGYFRVSTNLGNIYCIPNKAEVVTEILDKNMVNPINVSFYVMAFSSDNSVSRQYFILYGKNDSEKAGGPYESIFYRGLQLGEIPGFEKTYSWKSSTGQISVFKLE